MRNEAPIQGIPPELNTKLRCNTGSNTTMQRRFQSTSIRLTIRQASTRRDTLLKLAGVKNSGQFQPNQFDLALLTCQVFLKHSLPDSRVG